MNSDVAGSNGGQITVDGGEYSDLLPGRFAIGGHWEANATSGQYDNHSGGYIQFQHWSSADDAEGTAIPMEFFISDIDVSGGDGTANAGDGGSFYAQNETDVDGGEYYYKSSSSGTGGGIYVGATVTSNGGDASFYGGDGGDIGASAASDIQWAGLANAMGGGVSDLDGYASNGGDLDLYAGRWVSITGDFDGQGGDGGEGGYGGGVYVRSITVDVAGEVNVDAGATTTEDIGAFEGGHGGEVWIESAMTSLTGAVSARGADNASVQGEGGRGGYIFVEAPLESDLSAAADLSGGVGPDGDGKDGDVYLNGDVFESN